MIQSFSLGWWKILEVDSGDGYRTMWMCKLPQNWSVKVAKICIFYHNKKDEKQSLFLAEGWIADEEKIKAKANIFIFSTSLVWWS